MPPTPSSVKSAKSAKANAARAFKRAAAEKSANKDKDVTTFDDEVSDFIPPPAGGDSAVLSGTTQDVPEHKGNEEQDNTSVSTIRSGSSLTSALSQAEVSRIDSLIILYNDELPGVLSARDDFRAFQAYKAMRSSGQVSLNAPRPAKNAKASVADSIRGKMSREPPGGN
jgi:hypothetical protein